MEGLNARCMNTNTNTALTDTELKQIRDIIREQLDVQEDQITPDASLIGDLGADSLDMVEIGMKLEEAFSFSIGDDALENIKTVEDACVEVARLLGKG